MTLTGPARVADVAVRVILHNQQAVALGQAVHRGSALRRDGAACGLWEWATAGAWAQRQRNGMCLRLASHMCSFNMHPQVAQLCSIASHLWGSARWARYTAA